MRTKLFTLFLLLAILVGFMGLPKGNVEILFLIVIPTISYIFAIKLNLIPSKFYLNHHCILYFVWLIKEIIMSSLAVMKIIWSKDLKIAPVFEWIDASQNDNIGLIIYANSITLTPGTVTIDVSYQFAFNEAVGERVSEEQEPQYKSRSYPQIPCIDNLMINAKLVSNGMLLVHALDQGLVDSLKCGNMAKRVAKILANNQQ